MLSPEPQTLKPKPYKGLGEGVSRVWGVRFGV